MRSLRVFFFRLEQKRADQNSFTSLVDVHSVEKFSQGDLERILVDFYSSLFSKDSLDMQIQNELIDDRQEALRNKTKQTKEILPFVTTFNPAAPNLKKILMKRWHTIQQQPRLKDIFNQPPIVSYRKEKSLKDVLVRAKIPLTKQQS